MINVVIQAFGIHVALVTFEHTVATVTFENQHCLFPHVGVVFAMPAGAYVLCLLVFSYYVHVVFTLRLQKVFDKYHIED